MAAKYVSLGYNSRDKHDYLGVSKKQAGMTKEQEGVHHQDGQVRS